MRPLIAAFLLLPIVLAGPAKTPRFTIETLSQIHANCELDAFDEKGVTASDGGAHLKVERFLELRRDGRHLPPLLTREFVLLTTGDRIPLDPAAGATLEENRLVIWPAKSCLPAANAKGLSVYLPYVVAVFWSVPEGIDDADLFVTRVQEESRKRDVVYLKNGDRIEGLLTSLNAKTGAVVTVGGKRIETPWPKIAGLAWNTERAVRPRPKKTYSRVVLEAGGRISLQDFRLDAKTRQFSGKTLFGTPLEFPEANLIALDVRLDQSVDLSEFKPARYEHQPFFGAAWPLGKDAAATGQPLRLAKDAFEKGLGMHAASRVSYLLEGKYERFDALVGIDTASPRGRAKIALELDGKRVELNDGKEMTAKDQPLIVRQDVRKVRELMLIVELGPFGDVQANVNWAKARLIKK